MINYLVISLWAASLTLSDVALNGFPSGTTSSLKPISVNYQETQKSEQGEDWEKMVSSAFAEADVVVLGSVRGIRNYRPMDGGIGYDIEVLRVFKGKITEQVSFRIGGWAYVIKYAIGEKVLLFLKGSKAFFPDDKYISLHDKDKEPIALRILEDGVIGLRGEAKSEWGRHRLDEYLSLLKNNINRQE